MLSVKRFTISIECQKFFELIQLNTDKSQTNATDANKKMHTIMRFASRELSAYSTHRWLPQCYGRDVGFSYGSHRSRRARTARTHRHAANPADGESNDPCQDASAHEAAEPRSNRMAWSDTPNSANYAITDSRGRATRTPAQAANRHAGCSFRGTARSSSPSSYRAHTPRPRCTCRTPNGQARTPPKNRG